MSMPLRLIFSTPVSVGVMLAFAFSANFKDVDESRRVCQTVLFGQSRKIFMRAISRSTRDVTASVSI